MGTRAEETYPCDVDLFVFHRTVTSKGLIQQAVKKMRFEVDGSRSSCHGEMANDVFEGLLV
jgi:hypothetical protein